MSKSSRSISTSSPLADLSVFGRRVGYSPQLGILVSQLDWQFNTLEGLPWPTTSPETKKRFGPAMKLGDLGRRLIKGHDLAFYSQMLAEVRERIMRIPKAR